MGENGLERNYLKSVRGRKRRVKSPMGVVLGSHRTNVVQGFEPQYGPLRVAVVVVARRCVNDGASSHGPLTACPCSAKPKLSADILPAKVEGFDSTLNSNTEPPWLVGQHE